MAYYLPRCCSWYAIYPWYHAGPSLNFWTAKIRLLCPCPFVASLHLLPRDQDKTLNRFYLFTAHDCSSTKYGLDRFYVASAAAKHTGKRLAYLLFRRIWLMVQQCSCSQYHRWRAISTLNCPSVYKSLLEGIKTRSASPTEFWTFAKSFNRG